MNIHCKDWYWSWNSNTLATWCEEMTHWKRSWCWERLKVGGEGDNRGWNGWMASLTQWTWVWASSGCWWWTLKLGKLQSMGLQRVRYDWATELNLVAHMSFYSWLVIYEFVSPAGWSRAMGFWKKRVGNCERKFMISEYRMCLCVCTCEREEGDPKP